MFFLAWLLPLIPTLIYPSSTHFTFFVLSLFVVLIFVLVSTSFVPLSLSPFPLTHTHPFNVYAMVLMVAILDRICFHYCYLFEILQNNNRVDNENRDDKTLAHIDRFLSLSLSPVVIFFLPKCVSICLSRHSQCNNR